MPAGNAMEPAQSPQTSPWPRDRPHSKGPTPPWPPHVGQRTTAGTKTRTRPPRMACSYGTGTSMVRRSTRSLLKRVVPVKLLHKWLKISPKDGLRVSKDRKSETSSSDSGLRGMSGLAGGRLESIRSLLTGICVVPRCLAASLAHRTDACQGRRELHMRPASP